MQIGIILNYLKYIIPILLLCGSHYVAFTKGEKHIQEQWDIRELELTKSSVETLYQAKQKELTVVNELNETKQQIEVNQGESNQIISDLTTSNRKLLANRMHRSAERTSCGTGGLSEDGRDTKGATQSSETTYWNLSKEAGEDIISDYEEFERVNLSRNVCLDYITKLHKLFN